MESLAAFVWFFLLSSPFSFPFSTLFHRRLVLLDSLCKSLSFYLKSFCLGFPSKHLLCMLVYLSVEVSWICILSTRSPIIYYIYIINIFGSWCLLLSFDWKLYSVIFSFFAWDACEFGLRVFIGCFSFFNMRNIGDYLC